MNINNFEPIRSGNFSVQRAANVVNKKSSGVRLPAETSASDSVSGLLKGLSPNSPESREISLSEIKARFQAGGYATRAAAESVADSILREA